MRFFQPGSKIRIPNATISGGGQDPRVVDLLSRLGFDADPYSNRTYVMASGFYGRVIHHQMGFMALSIRLVNGDEELIQVHLHVHQPERDYVLVLWPRVQRLIAESVQRQA